MTWKKVNQSDAGTASKFGGNDLDKVSDAFNGVNVSDPINYNVDINALKANTNTLGDILKNNGTKYLRFAKGTANQVLKVNAAGTDLEWGTVAGVGDVTGGANVGAGTGQIFRDKTAGTLNLKTLVSGGGLSIANNANDITLTATGGGGGSAGPEAYSYLLYIATDGSYKAKNGLTGADDFSSGPTNPDAGAVLGSIFNSVSATTPLSIEVGAGNFDIRTWDANAFKHSYFSIRGQGSEVTTFTSTTALGGTGIFVFQASPTQYTSNPLSSDAGVDNFSVLSNTENGIVAGCYVLIGSNSIIARQEEGARLIGW